MPSVQLNQLHQEIHQLGELFPDPEKFLKQLERLLEAYAARVHRQGRVKGVRPVLFSYEAPQPVFRRLELEMAQQAADQPQAALSVVDGLWARRSMETRQFAIRLLGATPAPAAEVTRRLEAWAAENREELLADELYQYGVSRLVRTQPGELLAFAGRLLASSENRLQILALGALQSLLAEDSFANLPALFDLLGPACQDPPKKLRPYLAELLGALAEHTPKETAYFLQQLLAGEPGEGARWVARQTLRHLPAETQAELREQAK